MTADSPVHLITLLAGKTPGEILGTRESEWVDFKGAGPKGPYDLSTDKGKFELAKDVAAFANTGGGLIVCGFRARRRTHELHETADKEIPFEKRLFSIDSYKDVITEYIRPLVKVDYHWFDHPENDEGITGHYFVIEVKALPTADRWALVTRGLTENGEFVKGSWTVPIRHGDTTTYLTPDDAYGLLNDGLRTRRGPAAPPPAAVTDPIAGRRDLGHKLGTQDAPMLFLQSTPDTPDGLLSGMYAAGGLRDAFQQQEPLRSAGFNFAPEYSRPEAFEGGLLLVDAPRRGLLVGRDGAVTAGAAATRNMLGWAMERFSGTEGRISVLALTELTLEYFRLVNRTVLPLVAGTWTHRIVATGFALTPPRMLAPGADPSFPLRGAPRPATSNDWNESWTATGDPERDAYEALRRLYMLFGLDVTDNPFADGDKVNTAKLLTYAAP